MGELQIVINQTPGVVAWNYEELKAALGALTAKYSGALYDDGSIRDAKKDLADLRKLKDGIATKRKEIKEACLAPYHDIERQASALTREIEKPISAIDKQVKAYEAAQKAKKRDTALGMMDNALDYLPPDIRERAKALCYNKRWENATFKEKDVALEIENIRAVLERDLATIEGLPEFRDAARDTYRETLSLSQALGRVTQLKEAREIARREDERRAAREAQLAAMMGKQQSEVQGGGPAIPPYNTEMARNMTAAPVAQEGPRPAPIMAEPMPRPAAVTPMTAQGAAQIASDATNEAPEGKRPDIILGIFAPQKDIDKVLGYLRMMRIEYTEM